MFCSSTYSGFNQAELCQWQEFILPDFNFFRIFFFLFFPSLSLSTKLLRVTYKILYCYTFYNVVWHSYEHILEQHNNCDDGGIIVFKFPFIYSFFPSFFSVAFRLKVCGGFTEFFQEKSKKDLKLQ